MPLRLDRESYDSPYPASHQKTRSRYNISHFPNIICAKRTSRMEDKQETPSSTAISEAELAKKKSEVADKMVADYEEPFDKSGGLTPLQALNLSIGDGPQSHQMTSEMQDLHIGRLIRNYKAHREYEEMLKGDFDLRQERHKNLATRLQEGQAGCEKAIRESQASLEHLLCFSYARLTGIEELIWGVGHAFLVDRMGRAVKTSEESDPHYPRIHWSSTVPSAGASNQNGSQSQNRTAHAEVEQSPLVAKADKSMVPSNKPDTDAEMEDIEATVARLGLTMDGPDIDNDEQEGDTDTETGCEGKA